MRRTWPLALGILALALVGCGYLARAAFFRMGPGGASVPVQEIVPGPFVREVTAEGHVRPVVATPLTASKQGRGFLIIWMAEDGSPVQQGDVVVRFDSDEATRALADGQDDHQVAVAKIQRERLQIKSALNERSRNAKLTEEEIARSRELGQKDPRFFPRREIIESEIDEAMLAARLERTQAAQQVEKRLGQTRVELLAVSRQKAELETKNAAKILTALELRAPHDGIFLLQRWGAGQRVLQVGDRVFSGMRIAEVATSDRMDAEVAVLEADAGGLVPGKRATVVLDARPDIVWKAKVKQVDPFPKPAYPHVPTQYFGALLEFEGQTAGIKPGQRLRARIVLDELPQALVVPRQAVFRNERGAFVYRRPGFAAVFEPVAVTLGPGTAGRVVVTSGLNAGDRIALRDPKVSTDETAMASSHRGKRAEGRVAAGPPTEPNGKGPQR
jgi:HlyD family secretion protein